MKKNSGGKKNVSAAKPKAKGGNSTAKPGQPFAIIDRGNASSYGYNNTLIEAAIQNQDRQAVNLVDYDIHRTITAIGRRTLLSLGRTMFWRIPALQAAIQEQAHLAVTPLTPRFLGTDEAWGKEAFDWLTNWHKVCDVAGWPYDDESYNETLIINNLVDGDPFTLLTEDLNDVSNGSGAPRIQMIGSHRIGSRYLTGGTVKIRYEGTNLFADDILVDQNLPYDFMPAVEWVAPLIDGVGVDDQGKAIIYRVYTDPAISQKYKDYSARDLFPAFLPVVPGQLRGFSALASSVFDWQDIREWRRFELLAQKIFASRTIVETNESGEDEGSQPQILPAGFNADGSKSSLKTSQVEGGTYTFLKSNTGAKLEAFDWDRPKQNAQDFNEMMVRDAMRGTEWDVFFSLDPKNVGGAPMRVIVDKINRVLMKRRRLVKKNKLRIVTYALAKAIKRGELAFNVDWFKWAHQGPTDVTADRRYDAQTDQMEYELGWATMEDIEKRRNGDWVLKREQKEKEALDKIKRAQNLVKASDGKMSLQEALVEMGSIGTTSFQRSERVEEIDTTDEMPSANPVTPKNPPKKDNEK